MAEEFLKNVDMDCCLLLPDFISAKSHCKQTSFDEETTVEGTNIITVTSRTDASDFQAYPNSCNDWDGFHKLIVAALAAADPTISDCLHKSTPHVVELDVWRNCERIGFSSAGETARALKSLKMFAWPDKMAMFIKRHSAKKIINYLRFDLGILINVHVYGFHLQVKR